MSFHPHSNASRPISQQTMSSLPSDRHPSAPFLPVQDSQFDVLSWYPKFQSCVRYFLDHAQHEGPVQATAAFINIQLPFQTLRNPISSSRPAGSSSSIPPSAAGMFAAPSQSVSLTPYIRRLVATGFDFPGVLHGFFGDDWVFGIGHLHEVERRNYLFAAKASNWLDVKSQYDMPDGQSVPFLRALQNATEHEIVAAEANWSHWLAMQDWMIGPRNPEAVPLNTGCEGVRIPR
ncbi:hypothetical protein GGR50DRAFT_365326 [Xylaria sp. CBS 124048]|nr:hypothetical protein GGR50DRAFT_365326 [Xylaria sp. CBS 124048]